MSAHFNEIQEALQNLVARHREDYRDGAVAAYIPELAKVDPRPLETRTVHSRG